MANYEHRIFELTNEERQKYNLPSLVWDDALASTARAHSLDLPTNNIFSHIGSDGSTPEQRLHRTGTTIRFLGENICGGRNNPEEAIRNWMASSGHKANILNADATYLGVGATYVASSRFIIYIVQIFGR